MYNTIKYIKDKIKLTPKIGLILGSGLTGISKLIKISYSLNYTDIPGMKTPSVHGHGGTFIFGTISGIPIVCASGRFHYYEGLGMDKVIMPVKIFYELGVKTIIITNSSGCLKKQWDLGSFMLIKSTMDFTFKENINDPLSVDISDHKFDKMTKLIPVKAKYPAKAIMIG